MGRITYFSSFSRLAWKPAWKSGTIWSWLIPKGLPFHIIKRFYYKEKKGFWLLSFQASLLKLQILGSLLQIVNLVLSLTTHSIVTFLVLGPWLTLRRLRRPQRLPFKLKRTVSWLFNQPVHCPLQVLSLEHNFYPVCLNIHNKCFPDIERISNPMVSLFLTCTEWGEEARLRLMKVTLGLIIGWDERKEET